MTVTELSEKFTGVIAARDPSARAQGLQLHPEFCRWHYPLTRLGPFGPCSLESCPLQQARQADHDWRDETRLLLDRQFGITLAQLRQAMGPSWELLQDSPETLCDRLQELRSRLAAGAPHRGGGAEIRSIFASRRGVSPPPLGNAADLLVNLLAPAVEFIGLGAAATTGVRDLLGQLAPAGAEQGTQLCLLLSLHFQAMAAFARQGRGPQPEDLAAQQEGLDCLEQFLEQFERLRKRLAQQAASAGGTTLAGRGLPYPATAAAAGPICRATAVETEDGGALIFNALIAALAPRAMEGAWSDGVLELLGERPPGDPLEAVLATQILLCRFMTIALPDRPEGPPQEERRRLEERYLHTESRLQQALERWRGQL